MILINLLPHREEKRRLRKVAFFAGLGASAVIGLAIVGGWYLILDQLKSVQQDRNQFLTAENAKLDKEIADIASLKAEIASLTARQKAVEDLQIDRNLPVDILNELVKQTPEGMYFTSVKQDGQVLNITGVAQTQERVSEFLRNTAYNSEWLTGPELIETKASAPSRDPNQSAQSRLFDFSVRVTVKRPQDQAAVAAGAASGASAPAGAASAVNKKAA